MKVISDSSPPKSTETDFSPESSSAINHKGRRIKTDMSLMVFCKVCSVGDNFSLVQFWNAIRYVDAINKKLSLLTIDWKLLSDSNFGVGYLTELNNLFK